MNHIAFISFVIVMSLLTVLLDDLVGAEVVGSRPRMLLHLVIQKFSGAALVVGAYIIYKGG